MTQIPKSFAAIVAGVVVIGAGTAVAAHVAEVDPTTVPGSFLAAHNHVKMSSAESRAIRKIARNRRIDVFVQHLVFGPNEATPWHSHAGPVIVTVVRGSFTYEREVRGECDRKTYHAGQGFVDRGFGREHRGVAGPEGAHLYATYLQPRGVASHIIMAKPQEECLP